uniref:Rhodopsin n=1 Tax=Cacopsylla melanoneura TaxID=428564 RepID=A0A8D9AYH3_9HEMI
MSWQPGGQPGYSPYGQAPPEPGFYPGVHPSAPPPGYPPQGGGYPQPGYPQPGYPPAAGYPAPGYPPPNQGPNMSGYGDIESGGGGGAFDFSEKTIRLAFIRKVYSILMIQFITLILIILAGKSTRFSWFKSASPPHSLVCSRSMSLPSCGCISIRHCSLFHSSQCLSL